MGYVTVAKSNLIRSGPLSATARFAAIVLPILLTWPTQVLAGTYTKTIEFSERDLRFSKFQGYDLVSLRGSRWLNRPGEPRMPLVPVSIGLPAGCQVEGLAVVAVDSIVLSGDFLLWPSQPPQPLSSPRPVEFVPPAGEVYTSERIYPDHVGELVGGGMLGGVAVCEIFLFPLRYVPSERRLIFYKEITFEISYRWQAALPVRGSSGADRELVESLVWNVDELWKKSQRMVSDVSAIPLGDETVSYLIITCDSLTAYFEPLREWKTRKGLPSQIITVEAISGSFLGSDLQEKIRNCIKYYHANSATDWILLGGDSEIIPDRKAYVPLSDQPNIPCDLYYSDLDGSWNADGDLYWGEVPSDNVDMYADVFIGGAPVSNSSEVETFVEKVLSYEGFYGVPKDYQLEALFMGEVLWGDPEDPSSPDYTDAGVAKDLIDSLYIPSRFSIEKLYESSGNLDYGTVMSELNQGKNFVNILCHGHYASISVGEDVVVNSDFESLANEPRYGLMYSATCFSGGFDQNDAIGEVWLLTPDGGGFFIGNSRYGWNCPGFPGEGPSDYYDQSFFESVFLTGFTNLGKAHADAKHSYVGESRTDEYMRYVMYGLNLLGDPELRLWTDEPGDMLAAFPPEIECGPQVYSVHVTSGGSPVPGAQVCLYKYDDVYSLEETNGAGDADISIYPSSPGTLLVTVTKPNMLPWVGSAAVVSDASPPAVPQNLVAEEASGPSVRIRWSDVSGGDLCCYKVYRNTSLVPESLAVVPGSDTTYDDTAVMEGTGYYYWVTSLDTLANESDFSDPCWVMVEGSVSVAGPHIEDQDEVQVRPNPFTQSVCFVIPGTSDSDVEVDVFDVTGRWICKLRPEKRSDGRWATHWDAKEASGERLLPGIYLVRLSIDKETFTRKAILLR